MKHLKGVAPMDFIDSLRQFSARAATLVGVAKTEEATKTALILPFFQSVLGYDVFNPNEFIPEFDADVGTKKFEKVDYAIIINGEPVILIEAKWCGEKLDKHDAQLFRYFVATKAKFGILTNGLIYKFYTDLEEQNKMDLTPFLEVDLLNIKDSLVPELKHFCKGNFDAEDIFNRASELKYSNQIRTYFTEQLQEPSDDFTRFMISPIYKGVKNANVIEQFRPIVKHTLNTLINEMMTERINTALKKDSLNEQKSVETAEETKTEVIADSTVGKIITTQEELQAFYIVKAILAEQMEHSKITYKDTVNYFSIVYDESSIKWICRLRLGSKKKSISLPNENNEETRTEIVSVDDIYQFKTQIIESAKRFIEVNE